MKRENMSETNKRGRGRPRSTPTEGNRYSIFTNVSADTRVRLERAADRNGQSLAKEADDRLRQSLLDDEHMGGGATAQFFRTLAGVVWSIEQAYGTKWSDDPVTAMAVESAVSESVAPLLRTASLDWVGQLAVMDEMDLEEQQLDAETMAQVRERQKVYADATEYGRRAAFRAFPKRLSGNGQA